MGKMTWLLVACASLVITVIVSPIRSRDQKDAQYFRSLDAWLVANQKQLDNHAELVILGRVRKQPASILYEPPNLPRGAFSTSGATVDANTNVYFVLTGSHVMFNLGLVKRRGKSVLLGDGTEPRIVYTKHLHGDWWFYKAQ